MEHTRNRLDAAYETLRVQEDSLADLRRQYNVLQTERDTLYHNMQGSRFLALQQELHALSTIIMQLTHSIEFDKTLVQWDEHELLSLEPFPKQDVKKG
jgi:hypothetical protein